MHPPRKFWKNPSPFLIVHTFGKAVRSELFQYCYLELHFAFSIQKLALVCIWDRFLAGHRVKVDRRFGNNPEITKAQTYHKLEYSGYKYPELFQNDFRNLLVGTKSVCFLFNLERDIYPSISWGVNPIFFGSVKKSSSNLTMCTLFLVVKFIK